LTEKDDVTGARQGESEKIQQIISGCKLEINQIW